LCEKCAHIPGTALLESFCQEELHLQNPTSNPNHQVSFSFYLAQCGAILINQSELFKVSKWWKPLQGPL